jgi:CO dehydrogenase maturation factor
VEQVNRRVMRSVSHLLLVSDATLKGIRVAEAIRKVADKAVDYRKMGLIINRARDESDARGLADRTELPLLGWIPEDDTVREFDNQARSFLEMPICPALEAVRSRILDSGFLS